MAMCDTTGAGTIPFNFIKNLDRDYPQSVVKILISQLVFCRCLRFNLMILYVNTFPSNSSHSGTKETSVSS